MTATAAASAALSTALPALPSVPAGRKRTKKSAPAVRWGAKELLTADWRVVEAGLPLSALEDFVADSGIPMKELLEVVIPPRTLKHRRQRGEPLNLDESDRLARVARIFALAVRVYGDREEGRDWLLRSKDRFEQKTALEMLRSYAGGLAVEEFLYQIDEGVFA